MVVLTGDTHREFKRIEDFCRLWETRKEDILIVLGDVGINYLLDERDENLKRYLSNLPITFFCVHGNHEERPENVPGYELCRFHGGQAWYQPEYPDLLFARDGEIYDFNGKKAVVIGGAYSVDKSYRLAKGLQWFPSEQPDGAVRARVEDALDRTGWRVDYVLSHAVPISCVPTDRFLPMIDQSTVDRSTEQWLDELERKLDYRGWYAGHYHITRDVGKVHFLYEDYWEMTE